MEHVNMNEDNMTHLVLTDLSVFYIIRLCKVFIFMLEIIYRKKGGKFKKFKKYMLIND